MNIPWKFVVLFGYFVSSSHFFNSTFVYSIEILSKSKLEKCEKGLNGDNLNCTKKIVLNMAVPSASSGGEASIIAEVAEVEENSSTKMQTLRVQPVITVKKSATYASYELSYIRDVPYKPQEFSVKTRKCERDAGADIVEICERLRDENGHIIEHTQPMCCPCGNQRRMPSSCGNFFDKLMKGKANTAHCLRFPGDWFHVFGIGQRTLGFSILIEVKTGSKISEVVLGPDNRTATSSDNFLRVDLIGDFGGYTSIPSFEDFYLVTPGKGAPSQPEDLGRNFSMWMLLERVRFTFDGIECNKIGVSYEAFNSQPSFCGSPFWSCLHNQLWNFRDADRNRMERKQLPLYVVEGRFERINQHPNAGPHSFSIGVTESLSSNLLIELSADDIEYVYQRSPGKILSITVPTFEALSQFGTATITMQNIGDLEASYSLTFNCLSGVNLMEEQFFIMKPKEIITRAFKIYPTIDQAAKYSCSAILKDSDFIEADRAECQFTTTATVLDNGSLIGPFVPPKSGVIGFFESIRIMWNRFWHGLLDFITGRTCRKKCLSFFDLTCHIQYICMSWVALFSLLLGTLPTVCILLWLLYEKGFFDSIHDSWEDDDLLIDHRVGRHHTPTAHQVKHGDRHHDMRAQHHHHYHHHHHLKLKHPDIRRHHHGHHRVHEYRHNNRAYVHGNEDDGGHHVYGRHGKGLNRTNMHGKRSHHHGVH